MIDFKRQSSPNGRRKLDTNPKLVVPSKTKPEIKSIEFNG